MALAVRTVLAVHAVLAAALVIASASPSDPGCNLIDRVHKFECGRISGCISIHSSKGSIITIPPRPAANIKGWCFDDSATVSIWWDADSDQGRPGGQFNIYLKEDKKGNTTQYHVFQFQYIYEDKAGNTNGYLFAEPKGFKSFVDGGISCSATFPMVPWTPEGTISTSVDLSGGGTLNLTSFYIEYRKQQDYVNFVSTCLVEPDITLIMSVSGVVTGLILFAGAILAINVSCR